MKNFYRMSMKILTACLFLKLGIMKAQLTVIGLGNYNVGAVSDNGVVSLHTSAGAIYKWNASGGLVQIGSISNGYPAAGRTIVSNDGTKISSSVTNAATGFNLKYTDFDDMECSIDYPDDKTILFTVYAFSC